MVELVKAWQRMGGGKNNIWCAFAMARGSETFDPNHYDVGTLSEFLAKANKMHGFLMQHLGLEQEPLSQEPPRSRPRLRTPPRRPWTRPPAESDSDDDTWGDWTSDGYMVDKWRE